MNTRERLQEILGLFVFLAILGTVGGLTGCASAPILAQPVKVPVPVACDEKEPDRPVMPTEALIEADSLDRKTAAALAEIDLREGYEAKLVAALRGCTRPIAPAP
jgi:hypothetical protein